MKLPLLMLRMTSYLSLAGILIPCLLFLTGRISHSNVTLLALISTIVWFSIAPFWMKFAR